jgi:hypothetical protein
MNAQDGRRPHGRASLDAALAATEPEAFIWRLLRP